MLLCSFSFSSAQNTNSPIVNFGADNYQSLFFNPFFYNDFSYRFERNDNIVNCSFGKSVLLPSNCILSLRDTLSLDSIKAKSNIYLLLGTKKNQGLQIENIQRIGRSSFAYLKYTSIASMGFLKNSYSKNRSFQFQISHSHKYYSLLAGFNVVSNNDGSSGGIIDTITNKQYSKGELQQLEVYLNSDALKKKYFDVELQHKFLLHQFNKKSFCLLAKNNYSRFKYNYLGEGVNDFYSNTFLDSSATKDTLGYAWWKNDFGFTFINNYFSFESALQRNDFQFLIQDSSYFFNDLNLNTSFGYSNQKLDFKVLFEKNIGSNFRKNNSKLSAQLVAHDFGSFFNNIVLYFSLDKSNVPFVYQKLYSNHFLWNNTFDASVNRMNAKATFNLRKAFSIFVEYNSFENRVFLNEYISPERSIINEQIFNTGITYNDTIGKLHIIEHLIFSSSNSQNYPVIPLQSFTKVGYQFQLFKNNLKVEAGISGSYTDSWYAYNYSPALDDFYLQSRNKFNGTPILNVFADFKIKAATLFLKIERINAGWINENNFTREGYPIPPRTIRFGFNWPLSN